MNQQVTLTRQAVRTPRAAAVAGIIFSVLFTTSMVLIRLALPEDLRGTNVAAWLQGNTTTISLALTKHHAWHRAKIMTSLFQSMI